MGQLKKIVPVKTRDRIFNFVDRRLPEGSVRRKQFANAISVGGATLVVAGSIVDSKGYKKTGMALRGVGETADDFDGDTARRLGTAGKSGAIVDSFLDKIKVAVELGVLWKHAKEMNSIDSDSRKKRLAFIGGKHLVNATLNTYITARGVDAKTSHAGQINMWMDGLAVGFWGIADASDSSRVRTTANILGNTAFGLGILSGADSMYGYMSQAIHVNDALPNTNQYYPDTANIGPASIG